MIHKMKKRLHVFFGVLAIIVVTVIFLAVTFFGNYYSYGSYAKRALKSTDKVTVKGEDDYILFDGPGTGSAVIFYPGARVAAEAYAPLMQMLAKKGFDCFLIKMPLNHAIFGKDRAAEITSGYSYDEFILAGHSLGGVVAAEYLSEHNGDFTGLIMMGSYPTVKVDDSINFLSILGSNDKVVNADRYEKAKENWPKGNSHDYLIFGGNHSYFGNYGVQDGDGEATIKNKTQWRQTAEVIEEYYK